MRPGRMRVDNTAKAADAPTNLDSIALIKTALALLSANPTDLQGMVIYGQQGPLLDALKKSLTTLFNPLQLPHNVGFTDLHGGLDTSLSLAQGRLINHIGLLQRSAQSGLIISSAQRLPAFVNAELCAAIDARGRHSNTSTLNDDQNSKAKPVPKVIIAIDDSLAQEPGIHASGLAERIALHIAIPDISVLGLVTDVNTLLDHPSELFEVDATYELSIKPSRVILTDKILKDLTCVALQLGISSMLPLIQTCKVARTLAALNNREAANEEDALLAVQLALAPHAMNSAQENVQEEPAEQTQDETVAQDTDSSSTDEQPIDSPSQQPNEHQTDQIPDEGMQEQLIAAAQASLPQHLLASLASTHAQRTEVGRDKQTTALTKNGRPIGILRPKGGLNGQRINVIETLKAAVPMQRIRRPNNQQAPDGRSPVIQLHKSDLRITKYRQSSRTTTVFIVDASGSSAMHRLAEAKGAVELLLAECYVRRDRVALITFRGTQATLDLPPTRSLTRAKRALQNLPGGGGTPLASGLQLAYRLISSLTHDGQAPIGVLMTDAKANIALDGSASREMAANDVEHQSQLLKSTKARLLFVDTASRQSTQAQKLAASMGAQYLPLPRSNAQTLPNILSGYAK